MAALAGTVVLLGITIYLVRHTFRSEPVPAHEQQEESEAGPESPRRRRRRN